MSIKSNKAAFLHHINCRITTQLENQTGGTDLELIDTHDYRDILAAIHPDQDEPREFAPLRDERF